MSFFAGEKNKSDHVTNQREPDYWLELERELLALISKYVKIELPDVR